MIYFSEIIPTEIVQTIGWTLLNSLWQGMAIALLLAIALFVFRKKSAQFRYALSVSAMGLLVIAAVVTYVIEYQLIIQVEEPLGILRFDAENSNEFLLTQLESTSTWFTYFIDYFNQNIPLMVLVWMLGILFMGLRMIGEITYVYHLKNYQTQIVPNAVQLQLETLLNQLNIQKRVKILESLKVQTPMVIGFLKPVILMPIGLISGLSSKQIESILAHELVHIKRHDFAINLLQSFVEVLLFFNPAVWWISACIRAEREHCCDDLAIQVTGDKTTFVKTLAQLEEIRISNQFAMAFANNRNGVLHRIRRILKKETTFHGFSRGFWGSLILVMCFFLVAFSEGEMESQALENDLINVIDNEFEEALVIEAAETTDVQVDDKMGIRSEEVKYLRDDVKIKKISSAPLSKFIIENSEVPVLEGSINENSLERKVVIKLDSVPKTKRELELLDKRISELQEKLIGIEKEIKPLGKEHLEGFQKARDAEIAAMKQAAAKLEKEEAYMEKEVMAKLKYQREMQELKMKEAQSQLALAKEKMSREREMNFAKIEVEVSQALDRELMDLDEQKAKIERNRDKYSDEEYAQLIEEIKQSESQIKGNIEQELAIMRERQEHNLQVQELALQHEAQSMDLERKQMELAAKQYQMQLTEQKRHIEVAKKEIAREMKALENRDLSMLKREMEEARKRVAEEMEMLKMELDILKKERSRRVE